MARLLTGSWLNACWTKWADPEVSVDLPSKTEVLPMEQFVPGSAKPSSKKLGEKISDKVKL